MDVGEVSEIGFPVRIMKTNSCVHEMSVQGWSELVWKISEGQSTGGVTRRWKLLLLLQMLVCCQLFVGIPLGVSVVHNFATDMCRLPCNCHFAVGPLAPH